MKSKAAPYIFLAILLIIALVVIQLRNANNSTSTGEKAGKQSRSGQASTVNRNRGFDRRVSYIEYTRHARCRMECRDITQAEIKGIMQDGKINYSRSDVKDKPCPTYALEGYTTDRQHLRVVFAQCDQSTKVVTCIDLEKEWECHCPGDDNKNKNQGR